MQIFILMVLMAGPPYPILAEPKPVAGFDSQSNGLAVSFRHDQFECLFEPLSLAALKQHLTSLGASRKVLAEAGVIHGLRQTLPFRISLRNTGEADLNFNPDQILLDSKKGLVGAKVDIADFWPSSLPESQAVWESFATAFAKGSIQLQPGQSWTQLILFRPVIKRFPKRVTLELRRLYVGITHFNVACQYRVRYPKK